MFITFTFPSFIGFHPSTAVVDKHCGSPGGYKQQRQQQTGLNAPLKALCFYAIIMIAKVLQKEEEGAGREDHGSKRPRFSKPQMIDEGHSKPIYCIDFSKDIHFIRLKSPPPDGGTCSTVLDGPSPNHNQKHGSAAMMDVDVEDSKPKANDPPPEARKYYRYMATCAGRYTSVYQVPIVPQHDATNLSPGDASSQQLQQTNAELTMVQSYFDLDNEEDFYACVFAGRSDVEIESDRTRRTEPQTTLAPTMEFESNDNNSNKLTGALGRGPQLLCVAGERRIIKVFDTVRRELVAALHGHGHPVYDLKLCPIDDFLLLSASKDRSIRMWNLRLGTNVAIFGGVHEGHKDDIVR